MCNEEAKNVSQFGKFLVVIGIGLIVWFGVSLVFPSSMGIADVKLKRKPTRLSLAQTLGKSNRERGIIHVNLQAKFKQIKVQAEQKAVEHQAWVKDIAIKINASGDGNRNTTEYIPGTDPQLDMMQLEHDKWSWIMQEIERMKQEIDARVARVNTVAKINYYLSGSPLAGLGECMVANSERTGGVVNPYMCVAVSEAESSVGRSSRARNLRDPFGMTGYGGSFPSWEAAIAFWFDNCLKHSSWAPWQNGHDFENPPSPYCETNQAEWAAHTTGIVNAIGRIEI